jgi:N6-adenosine-specific RNA methylase IME4
MANEQPIHDSNGIKMVTMPIASIFVDKRLREVDEKKVKEIAESMGEIGLLHPIVINSSNKLIAGAHRLEAAKLLGWTDIKCSIVNLQDLDLTIAEIDENLMRNDLKLVDRLPLYNRRKELHEIKYPETKNGIAQANAMNVKRKTKKEDQDVTANSAVTSASLPEPNEHANNQDTDSDLGTGNATEPDAKPAKKESRKKDSPKKKSKSFVKTVSDATGKSERTIYQEQQIAKNLIPEAYNVLIQKQIPDRDILALSKETPEMQVKILEKLKLQSDSKASYARAKKEVEHDEKKEELSNSSPPMPDGFYDVIYIDPPWSLEDKGSRISPDNAATFKYPTMSIEEICTKQPPIDVDAVMFLWVPATMIREALQLIDAWGFIYKTNGVWDKGVIGMGHYFRTQHEHLFLGTKGSIGTSNAKNISSVFKFPRREHSRKPDELYEIIERMYPKRRYLECYARDAPTREGWTAWGNQA